MGDESVETKTRPTPRGENEPGNASRAAPVKRLAGTREAVSSSDSDSGDSDCDLTSPSLGGGGRKLGVSPMKISPQKRVTVLNFGTVDLEGSTSGVEVGNKTEYLGSVTVQQIVHGGEAASHGIDVSQAVLRGRRRAAPREVGPIASAFATRRTGLVLRSNSVGSGLRESTGKRGNLLLWRHLLGRKVEIAIWLPIALVCCIALMAGVFDNFIFAFLHHRRDLETSFHIPISQSLESDEDRKALKKSLKRKQNSLPNLHRSVIIPREMWNATPPKEFTPLQHPVEYVIISHTATEPCDNQKECSLQVLIVQRFHVESRHWSDIGYNFLVGGDGNSYEGRGWEYVGAHSKGYNTMSIGISFIGTFSYVLPPPAQIRACKLLIKEGVGLGKISSNYKLLGHRQVSPTESPGEKLYEELQNWEHWSPEV